MGAYTTFGLQHFISAYHCFLLDTSIRLKPMANRASLDQRPDAKLAMLGGSQGATVGTVDTRMVGGNMISTTYSYTNNVFAPPSGSGSLGGGATEPQEDPSAQLPDVRPSLWHSIEVLAIVYRLLRPFGVHSQASKTECDSSLVCPGIGSYREASG